MAQQRKVDVVTVGAGFAGAVIAQQLADAGLQVVTLERGPERWTTPDFEHNHDTLRYDVRNELAQDLGRETWTWRPDLNSPSLPMRQFGAFQPGSGNGGSSVHWTAQNWRFLPQDFRYRSHHIERYGEGKLPEGSRIQDWGITYEELEPYFDQFEYDIGMSGQAGNINGEIIPGGNPFEGPRTRPYPLPPLETSIPADMFAEACRALGYHPFPQPSAILSRGYTGLSGLPRAACNYCGYCTRFGCEVDAKGSAITDHIPAALETGRYELRFGCTVTGITIGADGLATGVSYIDAAGQLQEQPADIVYLTAFTMSNVRLLLLSRSQAHPDGIGNAWGMVGKNFTHQISQDLATGVFEGRHFNLFMGHGCINTVIYDFFGDNFDHSNLDFIGGGRVNAGGGQRNPLTSASAPQQSAGSSENQSGQESGQGQGNVSFSGRDWGQAWKDNLRRNWDSTVGIGYEGDSLPYEDHYLDLDPVYKDIYGLPLLRYTYSFKQNEANLHRYLAARAEEIMQRMGPTYIQVQREINPYDLATYQSSHVNGGAIMGSEPDSSVVNKYCQVWDTPNVFVVGATNFPQNPGANPTGTVCALAYHSAAAVKETYLDDPNRIIP
jgi:gluconate 2-dehydrogenase alpha chain